MRLTRAYSASLMQQNKIKGFDFIRSFAVLSVFIAHILNKQSSNHVILFLEKGLSPGLTMSLLGSISGYLLTKKYKNTYDGDFFVRRFLRIYSSLVVCLTPIVILHILLGYDVINQHSILHYMGLSYFIELLQVANQSSIGEGLWFVTIINIMYLLLPLLTTLYIHHNGKYHLFIVVITFVVLNFVMYSTASAWNVVIAFNIGAFLGLNSSIEKISRPKFLAFAFVTILLVLFSSLSSAHVFPNSLKNILFPLYPIFSLPFLYTIGEILPGKAQQIISWFSTISYEFYIIHFYFINDYYDDLLPHIESVPLQIITSLVIILPLAYILKSISAMFFKSINCYLIPS